MKKTTGRVLFRSGSKGVHMGYDPPWGLEHHWSTLGPSIAEKQSKRSKKAHFRYTLGPPGPTQEMELMGPGGEIPSRPPPPPPGFFSHEGNHRFSRGTTELPRDTTYLSGAPQACQEHHQPSRSTSQRHHLSTVQQGHHRPARCITGSSGAPQACLWKFENKIKIKLKIGHNRNKVSEIRRVFEFCV